MLQIDYDLIPLTDETLARIDREAQVLARRGRVPQNLGGLAGRLEVVNPNMGYTQHHVPDELRKPLRRSLVQAFEGGKPVAARDLAQRILSGEETLHALLIEWHSDFPAGEKFLRYLPLIQWQNPLCRLILHGGANQVAKLIRGVVAAGGHVSLTFPGDTTLNIDHPGDMGGVVTGPSALMALGEPFFTHVKLRLGDRQEWFSWDTLPRLAGTFGYGHTEDQEMSQRQRERALMLEIPFSQIVSFRLSPKPHPAVKGFVIDNKPLPQAQIGPLGLDKKELPLGRLKALIRRRGGEPNSDENIPLVRLRALRLQPAEGKLWLLPRPHPGYLPLQEAISMQMAWSGDPAPETPTANLTPGDNPRLPYGVESWAGEARFEVVCLTEANKPDVPGVRAAVRQAFLQTFFRVNLERAAKLEAYAGNLRIGCLGAMSAQALRLFMPFGLSRFIPPQSVYFLSDTLEGLGHYNHFPKRMEAMYGEVLSRLNQIFQDPAPQGLTVMHHRVPVILDWLSGQAPPFAELDVEKLSAVHNELRAFLDYSEAEFKRHDPEGVDIQAFFAHLTQAQGTLLLVRQLSNLIGGKYGRFFEEGQFPDFVFFGPQKDLEQNARNVFLPGLSWSHLLEGLATATSFDKDDLEFAVFLEEQLSIIESIRRQSFDQTPREDDYDRYFDQRMGEVQTELDDLAKVDDLSLFRQSPKYQKTFEELFAFHHQEIQALAHQISAEMEKLTQAETLYFDTLGQVMVTLEGTHLPVAELLAGENYIMALDASLAQVGAERLSTLRDATAEASVKATRALEQKRQGLRQYLLAYVNLQKALFPYRRESHNKDTRQAMERALPPLLDELGEVTRLNPRATEEKINQWRLARVDLREQRQNIEAELASLLARSQQDLMHLQEALTRLTHLFTPPLAGATADLAPPSPALTPNPNPPQTPGETPRQNPRQIPGPSAAGNTPPPPDPLEAWEALVQRQTQADRELQALLDSVRQTRDGLDGRLVEVYALRRDNALAIYTNANRLALAEDNLKQGGLTRMMGRRVSEPPVTIPPMGEVSHLGGLEVEYQAGLEQWRALDRKLAQTAQSQTTQGVIQAVAQYRRFQQTLAQFHHAVRQKQRHHYTTGVMVAKLATLKATTTTLEQDIHDRMIPAYRVLALNFILPQMRNRLENFKKARVFVKEVSRLPFDSIRGAFLDRAVFRRFNKEQFRTGAYYGLTPDHPLFNNLRNVTPALFQFQQVARLNLEDGALTLVESGTAFGVPPVVLDKLPPPRTAAILEFCEAQAALPPEKRYNYLVLPSTLPLPLALDIILHKEKVFNGLPQLVLVYLGRFDASVLHADATLREKFFVAVHHNVIINLAHGVVDSPMDIARRLAADTLGSAYDLPDVRFPGDFIEVAVNRST